MRKRNIAFINLLVMQIKRLFSYGLYLIPITYDYWLFSRKENDLRLDHRTGALGAPVQPDLADSLVRLNAFVH